MVICEKALLRCIREDYKGDGYTVARKEDSSGEDSLLILQSADWLVEMEWKHIPKMLFGLLAQHMAGLPEIGTAYEVQRKETAATIFHIVDRFPETGEGPIITAHRTKLTYGGMEVWQKDGNYGVFFVPMDTAEMIEDGGRVVKWTDGGIYLEGKVSRIFVRPRQFLQEDPANAAAAFLSNREWR